MHCARRKILGFVLTIAISLTLPHVVFGGDLSFSSAGKFRAAPKIHRQQSLSRPFHGTTGSLSFGRLREQQGRKFKAHRTHPFHHFGLSDWSGSSDQQVIIVQEFSPAPTAEPREPTKGKIYVAPRWVDGEYGVQVLQPGYWTDRTPAAKP
jgi:hypothetical protein